MLSVNTCTYLYILKSKSVKLSSDDMTLEYKRTILSNQRKFLSTTYLTEYHTTISQELYMCNVANKNELWNIRKEISDETNMKHRVTVLCTALLPNEIQPPFKDVSIKQFFKFNIYANDKMK